MLTPVDDPHLGRFDMFFRSGEFGKRWWRGLSRGDGVRKWIWVMLAGNKVDRHYVLMPHI